MKWRDFLTRWDLGSLKIKSPILDAEFSPNDAARQAAWTLYVELLTRIAVQPLGSEEGDEAAALKSLHSLFETTRQVLKVAGPDAAKFAAVAVTFLNQVVRPFTAKWHPQAIRGVLDTADGKSEFRKDLALIRKLIVGYVGLVGDLAGVEDSDQLLLAGDAD